MKTNTKLVRPKKALAMGRGLSHPVTGCKEVHKKDHTRRPEFAQTAKGGSDG